MAVLTANEGIGARDASPAAARRLFTADGPADAVSVSDLSTRILASMNQEIVSDPAEGGRGILFCEDAKGWVGHCEVPASEMRSTVPLASAPREADVCIWLIERGHLTIEQNNGIHASFGPGALLLCDVAKPLRGRWDRSRFAFVRLSRPRLMRVLGAAPGPRGRSVETLERMALAPFLGSQLAMLANHGAALPAAELDTVLGGIFQTTEALLKAALAPGFDHRSAGPVAERLQAVHRYIQRNLHRQDLDVADIARGTSISRAQLYRLFASQDKSVHGTLREERLVKSLGYLQQAESGQLSIGAIAYACGFSDQAVFSKLFRQRFARTPREARASVRVQG